MLKFVWVGIIFAMIASIAFVVRWGIRPQPVSLLGASQFADAQSIGETVFDQLSQLVRTHRVLIWGGIANSKSSQEIIEGFLARAAHFHFSFNEILAQKGQYPMIPATKQIRFNVNGDDVAKDVTSLKPNQNLLILTVNVYSSHLLSNNPIARLEKSVGRRLLALTVAPLALRQRELESLTPGCAGVKAEASGTSALGCAMAARSKQLFTKHLPLIPYIATLDMVAARDYLMLVHAPKSSP